MKKVLRPELRTDWSSAVDGGMQLEISATVDGLVHQLVTLIADEQDESLWVQVYVNDVAVQISAETLREALNSAVGQVHSESWYDKNLLPGRGA